MQSPDKSGLNGCGKHRGNLQRDRLFLKLWIPAIHLIVDDVLSAIATTQDVVDRTRIFDTHLARHRPFLHTFRTALKSLLSFDSSAKTLGIGLTPHFPLH